jgi:hypothetical protein
MRSFYCSDQFVKLQLHGSTVPGLCVLDQEYHQERNDGRAGIYDQLPGIAEPKYRAANSPNYDDKHGGSKGERVSYSTRGPLGKTVEQGVVIHHSLLFIAIPAREDSKVEANPL